LVVIQSKGEETWGVGGFLANGEVPELTGRTLRFVLGWFGCWKKVGWWLYKVREAKGRGLVGFRQTSKKMKQNKNL
tara:strand:+ start:1358 stop:1585 length:228 start_codon:yes stop_codon:yes gene_type:complete